ncbi:hypothetical protein BH10PSE7_BH10PSE7_32180 [soil metagenome]
MRKPKDKIIGVTAFKAKCLGLVNEISSGKTRRVVLTRRGHPVAEITPVRRHRDRVPDPWGAMKDSMRVDPDYDYTAPSGLEFDIDKEP